MKNLNIAQTIANQIGSKALFMIGSKNLLAGENYLSFKVMRNSKGVTHIKIELNSLDTYDMTFFNIRGTQPVKIKAEHSGIYSDMLNKLIEKETGLYTKL